MSPWLGSSPFPVDNGARIYSYKGCKLLDHEPSVHASLADMFAKRMRFFGIRRIKLDEIEGQFEGVEGLKKVVFL